MIGEPASQREGVPARHQLPVLVRHRKGAGCAAGRRRGAVAGRTGPFLAALPVRAPTAAQWHPHGEVGDATADVRSQHFHLLRPYFLGLPI